MKLTLSLAVLVLLFSSCKKEAVSTPWPQQSAATLNVKIYPTVSNPRYAMLGDPNSVFSVGEHITIYVQYEAGNEQVSSPSLTIIDEMGSSLKWYPMTYSNYPGTEELSAPEVYSYPANGYFAATIIADETLAGKTLTLRAHMNGSSSVGIDEMPNAFSVRD